MKTLLKYDDQQDANKLFEMLREFGLDDNETEKVISFAQGMLAVKTLNT